jgi:hypothetical protein
MTTYEQEWVAHRDPLSGIGFLDCGNTMRITDLDFEICKLIADAHNGTLNFAGNSATTEQKHNYGEHGQRGDVRADTINRQKQCND